MSCGSKTKEIDFQFWFDMKSKPNPNLTNVMALPLHFKSTNYAMVCSVFGRHEQYSSRDPTQLIGHCNKLWLFWIGEKWKITHSRSGPGHTGCGGRSPPIDNQQRSVCLLLASRAFSFSFTIIWHTMKMKVESSSWVWYICLYTLLYNDERGCTIWWPVNVLNISNLFFVRLLLLSKLIQKQQQQQSTSLATTI